AQGVTKFDGQYVGALTLTGIVNGDCTTPPLGSAYPLSVLHGQVRFKYVPRFDTTLIGTVDPNGDFKASRRLKHGEVKMTRHIDPIGRVAAVIQSPSCLYAFKVEH